MGFDKWEHEYELAVDAGYECSKSGNTYLFGTFTENVDSAQSALKLVGPAGGKVARSQFMLMPERGAWQWVAFDEFGAVREVIEMPFVLATVCDSRNGALWALRGIAARSVRPDVRSTKN